MGNIYTLNKIWTIQQNNATDMEEPENSDTFIRVSSGIQLSISYSGILITTLLCFL